jgi:hypothetical protein
VRYLPAEYRRYQSLPSAFLDGLCVVSAVTLSAACVLVIVVQPDWAVVKFLLFGGCAAFFLMIRRHLLAYEVRVRLRPFLGGVRRGDVDGVGWLLEALAAMDGWTPYARRRARAALAAVVSSEQLLEALIFHGRRGHVSVAAFSKRIGSRFAGPLAESLASLDPDGRVRESAVLAMARRPCPDQLRFLVERSADWVPQVRSAAQQALRTQLAQWPELVPRAQAASHRIARRAHAAEVFNLVLGGASPPAVSKT